MSTAGPQLNTAEVIAAVDVRALETTVRRRDAVMGAVAFAATRFLGTTDWDEDVRAVLARLGSAVEVTRVYLFEGCHDDRGALCVPCTASGWRADAARRTGASQLDLVLDAAPDLPMVMADANRIEQVLSNLVGNAIKFTPRKGSITMRGEKAMGGVRFAICDTGPGIPPDQLPNVFAQFWQASKGDNRGIGLGLAIAKGIVEAHNGKIWVESASGAGATFYFTLPVA